jgi:hypothetical protein
VSLPLKLRNTSYIYSGGEEDEDEVIPCTLVEAMKIPKAINQYRSLLASTSSLGSAIALHAILYKACSCGQT